MESKVLDPTELDDESADAYIGSAEQFGRLMQSIQAGTIVDVLKQPPAESDAE